MGKPGRELVLEAEAAYGKLTASTKRELEQLRSLQDDNPTRAAAAVALRIDGNGYAEIAEILGYGSAQAARSIIEATIAADAGSPEEIDHLRYMAGRRLEKILQTVMPTATDPTDPRHLEYARMAITLIDRHLRLFGADAPQQMKVTITPSQAEIERWASEFAQRAAGALEEGEIIDAEVVDTDEGDVV